MSGEQEPHNPRQGAYHPPEQDQERHRKPRTGLILTGVGLAIAAVIAGGAVVVGKSINSAANSLSEEGPAPCTPGTEDPSCHDRSPTAVPTTTAPKTSASPTSTSEVPTTTATTTSVSSPSRTPLPTETTSETEAETTSPHSSTAPVPSPPPSPEQPAPQTVFTVNCDADPGYCVPDGGAPIYNAPFLGGYALNAKSNGDISTGIKSPHDGEALTPLCRGTGNYSNWMMVITPSGSEPNRSGQGRADSGYIESAVLPNGANAVAACTDAQDYSGNFN